MEPALIPLYCCWYKLKTAKALRALSGGVESGIPNCV
jgi:hypothetical protein